MPWPHCGAEVSDDKPCPTCGLNKQEWTLKVEVTRVLRLGSQPVCKIELRDVAGAYLAESRYVMAMPDGKTAEGALNAAGYAKASSKIAGDALVSFPDLGEDVIAVTTFSRPATTPGTFLCKLQAQKHEFKQVVAVANPQVDVLLRAAQDGTPFCEECAKAAEEENAQAAALLRAAQDGTPFCEECEQAQAA